MDVDAQQILLPVNLTEGEGNEDDDINDEQLGDLHDHFGQGQLKRSKRLKQEFNRFSRSF